MEKRRGETVRGKGQLEVNKAAPIHSCQAPAATLHPKTGLLPLNCRLRDRVRIPLLPAGSVHSLLQRSLLVEMILRKSDWDLMAFSLSPLELLRIGALAFFILRRKSLNRRKYAHYIRSCHGEVASVVQE